MKKTLYILYKEFRGYFISPIAYIVISIFLIITGWFFFSTFFLFDQAELRNFFDLLPITLSFIIPAITMKQFSEEFSVGSYELVKTLPVSTTHIILGKFIAAVAFSSLMLVPTIAYAISISFIGGLDFGPVIGGYIGSFFLIAAFSAIGVLSSSLSRNQIVSFIIGMSICFLITIMDKMLFFMPSFAVQTVQYLAADYHFSNISKGIVDSRDIIYFTSLSFLALYLTHYRIQDRG
jgi:ABC-2 type transport system permease protein